MNEKTPRTIRLSYLILACVTVLGICIGWVVLTWSFQSDNVIDIKQPIPVSGDKVARNSIIILKINYCKNTDARGSVERKLVSNRGEYLFPTVKDTTGMGCNIVEAPTLLPVLPQEATPDIYHIEYTVTYDLNPFKKGILEKFRTEDFKIE